MSGDPFFSYTGWGGGQKESKAVKVLSVQLVPVELPSSVTCFTFSHHLPTPALDNCCVTQVFVLLGRECLMVLTLEFL